MHSLACSGPGPAVQCLKRSLPNNALGNNSKGTDLKVKITSADPVMQLVCQSPELRDQRKHCLHKGLPAGPQGTGHGLQSGDMLGFNRVPWEAGVTLIPKGSESVTFVQLLEGNVMHKKVLGGGILLVVHCLHFGKSSPRHSDGSMSVKQKTCSAYWHPKPNTIC